MVPIGSDVMRYALPNFKAYQLPNFVSLHILRFGDVVEAIYPLLVNKLRISYSTTYWDTIVRVRLYE